MEQHFTSKFSVHADGHGVSRRLDESLNDATGVIEQIILDGDDSKPYLDLTVETLAALRVERTGHRLERAIDDVRRLITRRVTAERTMYPSNPKSVRDSNGGTVERAFPEPLYLDLDNVQRQVGRWFSLPCSFLLYGELLEQDSMFRRGRTEFICTYHDPSLVPVENMTPKSFRGTHYMRYDAWDASHLVGIHRTFPDWNSMVDHRRSVERAVKLIQETSEVRHSDADELDGWEALDLAEPDEYEDAL